MSPHGSNGPGCGGTATTACADIAPALAAASPPRNRGAVVHVAAGMYGAASCGCVAWFSVVIAGDGSGNTTVLCELTQQLLTANGSVLLTGLSVYNGLAYYNEGGGGGAVAVSWPQPCSDADGCCAEFTDCTFVGNLAFAVRPDAQYYANDDALHGEFMEAVGGGAISVVALPAATFAARVSVHRCVFHKNNVTFDVSAGATQVGGGGAVFVDLVGAGMYSVEVQGCTFVENWSGQTGGAALLHIQSEALLLSEPRVTISDCYAVNNTAGSAWTLRRIVCAWLCAVLL